MTAGTPEPVRSAGADQTDPLPQESSLRQTDAGAHARTGFLTLLIGSIGVVYGDIGTSPLYALREALHAAGATHNGVQRADVLGILSLVLWALTIIVTLKYVVILLRADNDGEGGTLSLMALAQRAIGGGHPAIFVLAIAGAALFFGDALITPAISVLSAVEGVKLITPALDAFVLPATIVIIIALFATQRFGTARVAGLFGPITLVWFAAMAIGGLLHIADDPGVFAALDPRWAASFMLINGKLALVALGAVFLAVTGAEALYADLGHFGRSPIRWAWMAVVFPSLALNYMGQAALVLAKPSALENPFFLLYPAWALAPIVVLATLATIIASQAVITGAYSLARQAIQLKLLPRMVVHHTSAEHSGQIYMPQINLLLLIGVLLLVVLFGSSSKLATAYGIAVTGTMIVTACLAFVVIWRAWKWPVWAAAALMAPFLIIDLVFFGANALKIVEGGYAPLLIGAGVMIIMWTWSRGTRLVAEKTRTEESPIADLARQLGARPPHRVRGTAVFLTADADAAPPALLHSLKHYKVLHDKNVLLTVKVENAPRVDESRRVRMETIDENFARVFLSFGYMEEPNVPKALALCRKLGWKFDIMSTSFFLSRRVIRAAKERGMPNWQDSLFIGMAQNAADASAYFHIPTNRVVEIGTQVSI